MSQTACPRCGSQAYKRNGYTRHAKQNHRCLNCGRQFSAEPTEMAQDDGQGKAADQPAFQVLN